MVHVAMAQDGAALLKTPHGSYANGASDWPSRQQSFAMLSSYANMAHERSSSVLQPVLKPVM